MSSYVFQEYAIARCILSLPSRGGGFYVMCELVQNYFNDDLSFLMGDPSCRLRTYIMSTIDLLNHLYPVYQNLQIVIK